LKVCREFDDVTSVGKLFHVRAVATGNARSPTVGSRVGGISSVEFDDDAGDARRCRPGIDWPKSVSQVGWSKSAGKGRYNSSPPQSYGTSLAIWDHTVLPSTRHKWTRPA